MDEGSIYRVKRLNNHLKDHEGKQSQFNLERYSFFLDAPFEISEQCCHIMKKNPSKKFEKETGKKPILGMMASESKLRTQKWLESGCNSFDSVRPSSKPMSFWTEQDVLMYIQENNLQIASVYGEIVTDFDSMGQCENQMSFSDFGISDNERPLLKTTGCNRTGCMFCGYGCHLEKSPNRFELMKSTHPKQYEYIMSPCKNGGLGYKEIIDWINEHGNMSIKY